MAKLDQLSRYVAIVRRLQKSPASYKDIESYVRHDAEIQGYNSNLSERNFHRHKKDIFSAFGIQIEFNHSSKVYHIIENDSEELNARLLDAVEMVNTIKLSSRYSRFMFFDKQKASGMQHLLPLLNAIKQKKVIELTYQRFGDKNSFTIAAEPYALKEFENRWYLLAKDTEDGNIKSYGLDRLLSFTLLRKKVEEKHFNATEYFTHCYGIIRPLHSIPQKITLSFTPEQGNYIKTLPLHSSQKILADNHEELKIELTVYPTFDFVMKLLSFGDEVEIISPAKLRQQIHRISSAVVKINS
jgi:predicted DNA-binding transcriptional regulator YafY